VKKGGQTANLIDNTPPSVQESGIDPVDERREKNFLQGGVGKKRILVELKQKKEGEIRLS